MLKDGINEIEIKSYDELVNIIYGKHKENKFDLRKNFVFRGLSNIKYELIPLSLRKDKLNQLKIDEIIETDKKFVLKLVRMKLKRKI